jgi:hypothetical protein
MVTHYIAKKPKIVQETSLQCCESVTCIRYLSNSLIRNPESVLSESGILCEFAFHFFEKMLRYKKNCLSCL